MNWLLVQFLIIPRYLTPVSVVYRGKTKYASFVRNSCKDFLIIFLMFILEPFCQGYIALQTKTLNCGCDVGLFLPIVLSIA